MSLVPYLFDDPWLNRPRRCLDDCSIVPGDFPRLWQLPQELLTQFQAETQITEDENGFQANIDVQQFKPEEISVKTIGDKTICIEGKHEEKPDEHGYISRHFVRRYTLPEGCDVKNLQSKLSSDGVLTVTAPKIEGGKQLGYREVPITFTGPVKNVEAKTASQNEP